MMKMTMFFRRLLLAPALIILFSAGCDQAQQANDRKTVKIAYINWSEGIAMTHLVQVILEEEMGFAVETKLADVAPVYASIAQGNQDFFLDAWLPLTHAPYLNKFEEDLVDLGVNYENARLGLVVPTNVSVNGISELRGNAQTFDGQIIGIDYGAGIMSRTEKAIETYELKDYKLISSSGPAMTASLKDAIDNDRPIVVTGWTPHWMFGRFELKFLNDPERVYGTEEKIHTIARKGFREDMPKVAAFLENFKMQEDHLLELMDNIYQSDKDPEVLARRWYENHRNVVAAWLPKE
jgi:glycine betaine/proline transport system substrate-binding protein